MMKKSTITAVLALVCMAAQAQVSESAKWQWPVKDAKVGEGVVYRPQDRIEKELNTDNLFIAAPEGAEVVSPADGTIAHVSIDALTSLTQMITFGNDGGTFDKSRALVEKREKTPIPMKYINGGVTLRLADGRKIHIDGLRGDLPFKTGQRISKGQTLGTVAYAYRKVGQPHISISVSTKEGKNDDPMKPFGLKTTFKKPTPVNIPQTLTVKQANDDFDFLISAMKECYPSFNDIITPEQCEQFVSQSKEKLKAPISYKKFYQIVRSAFSTQFLHDSHAWIDTENPLTSGNYYVPHVMIGAVDGKIFVRHAQQGYEKYLGKEVVSVDGISAKDLIERTRQNIAYYDGKNESHIAERLLTSWNLFFLNNMVARTAVMKFADGTTLRDQWVPRSQAKSIRPSSQKTSYIQRKIANSESQFSFRLINDSIALLTLSDFQLDQVQMETIADSLKRHLSIPNLIIDVRLNPGGQITVCNQLLSWFIDRPTTATTHYDKVNSNSTYQSFVHCMNYSPDDKPFEDYVAREGQEGFYNPSSIDAIVYPDSALHYGGRLYVLIDETSQSAATDFPAQLVRCGRAKTIGRETGTGYHYMTAVKFANLTLPNSHIAFTLPLVKTVLDDSVSERFPAQRGLLPDVEVPLTYEEFYTSERDIVLDKAIEMINTMGLHH